MKQVIEQFGRAMIAMLAGLAILGVFSTVPARLGELLLGQVGEVAHTNQKNIAFANYMNAPQWTIQVKEEQACVTGCWCNTQDVVTVIDKGGQMCTVIFYAGECETYVGHPMTFSGNGMEFYCDTPGVYRVFAKAVSQSGETKELQFRLLVNNEVSL